MLNSVLLNGRASALSGGGGNSVPLKGHASALAGGLITLFGSTLVGLVPDGNATVTVVLVGGDTRTVRVIDNAYRITTHRRAISVIAKTTTGHPLTIRAPG